ncbi:ribbon-helix-helix protein, CopG family [Candidatus Daviesbacteria bacterium]|nr:ribbon-helix-helix protein, CopG family [Candidatus Daviesbacteria bacterium]
MSNYVVTNIRLPEEDYLRLKEEAAKKRKSFSAIIREKVGSKEKMSKKDRIKMLLNLKTDWFTDKDYQEYKKIRKDLEKRLKKYNW